MSEDWKALRRDLVRRVNSPEPKREKTTRQRLLYRARGIAWELVQPLNDSGESDGATWGWCDLEYYALFGEQAKEAANAIRDLCEEEN